jgi:hypothetical protein
VSGLTNLLTNVGADLGVDIVGEWFTWDGGPGDLWVWGNLGGGVVVIQATIDESVPCEICGTRVSNTSTTSSAVVRFDLNHGTRIRAILKNTILVSTGVYARVN